MEIWKPLKNFPSYDGSSEGRIRNIRTQRILKTYINEKGYETVCLRKNGKQYTVKVSKVIDANEFVNNMRESFEHKFAGKESVIEGNMKAVVKAMEEVEAGE